MEHLQHVDAGGVRDNGVGRGHGLAGDARFDRGALARARTGLERILDSFATPAGRKADAQARQAQAAAAAAPSSSASASSATGRKRA